MGKHVERFNIAGTSFRQDAIFSLAQDNDDYRLTNKELVEQGYEDERCYKYYFNPKGTQLVPEPDNEHDPNAIKVITGGIHIGYVKASDCAHIKELMESGSVSSYGVDLEGGPYRIVSEDEDGKLHSESDVDDFFGKLLITVFDDNPEEELQTTATKSSAKAPATKGQRVFIKILLAVLAVMLLLLSLVYPFLLVAVLGCIAAIIFWKPKK